MRVVFLGNGFIDPVPGFLESAKPKLLKKTVVLSRDPYYISKMNVHPEIRIVDYSGQKSSLQQDEAPESESSLLGNASEAIAAALKKAGDVFFVATCGTAELAALPLLQGICSEHRYRFHILLVAPFLFQGKQTAEQLKRMIAAIGEEYVSVSLYYADELLKIDPSRGEEEAAAAEQLRQDFSMQSAFDLLERTIASTVHQMLPQIPKLSASMQYTYDFTLKQFSLAVDPRQLLVNMWYRVVNDDSLFHAVESVSKGILPQEGSLASLLANILNPEKKQKKKKSAYNEVKRNSIPYTEYREQLRLGRLDEIVDRIRIFLSNGDLSADSEIRKKSEERLRQEIRKFQVRQQKAEILYYGDQPTDVMETDDALAGIFLKTADPDPEEEQAIARAKANQYSSHETPYQRAVRAAAQGRSRTSPMTWSEISKSREFSPEQMTMEENRRMQASFVSGTEAMGNDRLMETENSPAIQNFIFTDEEQNLSAEKRVLFGEPSMGETIKANPLLSSGVLPKEEREVHRDNVLYADGTESPQENVEEHEPSANAVGIIGTAKQRRKELRAERSRRREEKRALKNSRRLAKAEEKAAAAAARAAQVKREIEIISGEKESAEGIEKEEADNNNP